MELLIRVIIASALLGAMAVTFLAAFLEGWEVTR